MRITLKQTAKVLCPPAIWDAAHWVKVNTVHKLFPPPPPPTAVRQLATLAEVDAVLDKARRFAAADFDAFAAILDGIALEVPKNLPEDPFSREYLDYQMACHKQISACDDYRAEFCEQIEVDEDKQQRPFPYYTRSATVIGEQLMAIGFMIRASATKPRQRVLEFGPGFGRLTLECVRMDLDVTAVEINPLYVDLIQHHVRREGFDVKLHRCGMLDYKPAERYDRVYFYECFHHCADHAAMVARLDSLVAPGGAVVFAGEPIDDGFPMPWGLRRDGRSLWAIRLFSWLELGFRTDYFLELLSRHGWFTTIHASKDVPWQRVFIARRKSEMTEEELRNATQPKV